MTAFETLAANLWVGIFYLIIPVAAYYALGLPVLDLSARKSARLQAPREGMLIQSFFVGGTAIAWAAGVSAPFVSQYAPDVKIIFAWTAPVAGLALGVAHVPSRRLQLAVFEACVAFLLVFLVLAVDDAFGKESGGMLGSGQYAHRLGFAALFGALLLYIGLRIGWSIKARLAQCEARVVRAQALKEFSAFYDRLAAREEAAA